MKKRILLCLIILAPCIVQGAATTYNGMSVPSGKFGSDITGGNYLDIDTGGVIQMYGTAKRKLTVRPVLESAVVASKSKPTIVTVGAFNGYSMPVWSSPVNADEQLFFSTRVPYRWDAVSDIAFKMIVCLSGAEDVGDKFQFQLSYNTVSITTALAATTVDTTSEVTVLNGRSAQYSCYSVPFTIDYDNASLVTTIVPRNTLTGRVRRIAASGNEISNNIIVVDWILEFVVDKIFGTF